MTDARNGCPERATEPPERFDQETINTLASMAWELTSIKSFCEDSDNFSDILLDAYNECFDRYRRLANAES